MNLPDLSTWHEITFGPAYHVPPLIGGTFPIKGASLDGWIFKYSDVAAEESEFTRHSIQFHQWSFQGRYLTLLDPKGQIIATIAQADPSQIPPRRKTLDLN